MESTLMIRLCSNVSSETSKYSSPSAVFSIPALMATNDEAFAARYTTSKMFPADLGHI